MCEILFFGEVISSTLKMIQDNVRSKAKRFSFQTNTQVKHSKLIFTKVGPLIKLEIQLNAKYELR